MQIFREIEPLRQFLAAFRQKQKPVGLVPTMGSLHEGHLKLVKASLAATEVTVCSVYVNPRQFNNPDDLARYPRTLESDTNLLTQSGCHVLFCPTDAEMYPVPPAIGFEFGSLDQMMEGKFRPGHFSGVALVVAKLLHIVEPDQAFFGQKDWQQTVIVRKLVDDLKFNTQISVIPTCRESDGLAMSSRNKRLTPDMRQKAIIFFKALTAARKQLGADADVNKARQMIQTMVREMTDTRLEYFEVVNRETLQSMDRVDPAQEPILCIAGYVGEVRLIDNMFF